MDREPDADLDMGDLDRDRDVVLDILLLVRRILLSSGLSDLFPFDL